MHPAWYLRWVNTLRPRDPWLCKYANDHWFRQWPVAWLSPSPYLNQNWNVANWIVGNKLQRLFNSNSHSFIHENAFEYTVYAAIMYRPQCVKGAKQRTVMGRDVKRQIPCVVRIIYLHDFRIRFYHHNPSNHARYMYMDGYGNLNKKHVIKPPLKDPIWANKTAHEYPP